MAHQHSSHVDAIKINEKLKTVIRKLDDGRCEYINGESDVSVAKELNMSPNSVGRLRLQLFGRFRALSAETVNGAAVERVAALEKYIAGLERNLGIVVARCDEMAKEIDQNKHSNSRHAGGNERNIADLRDRFAKLLLHLAVNRITDCRYLADPAYNGTLPPPATSHQHR